MKTLAIISGVACVGSLFAQAGSPDTTIWDWSQNVTFAAIVVYFIAYDGPKMRRENKEERAACHELIEKLTAMNKDGLKEISVSVNQLVSEIRSLHERMDK
jgi:hypothetical protein